MLHTPRGANLTCYSRWDALAVMAKRKTPTTRKGAAGKAAGKPKARKPSTKKSAAKPGPGHNQPPPDHVPPPPPISSWGTPMDNSAQVAHAIAARQRGFKAATIGTVTAGTQFAQAHDPTHLHQVMLNRIAALEETIAKLAALPEAEQIKPRPLDDDELEEIRNMVAKVKALPPVPAQRPPNAVEAESKLRKFGEQLLLALTVQAAAGAISAPVKELWASHGHQLIDAARSIAEWIGSLPPPPL